MWYQILVPAPVLVIPVLFMTTKCQGPRNDADIIVIDSNHAEADYGPPKLQPEAVVTEKSTDSTVVRTTVIESDYLEHQYITERKKERVPVTEKEIEEEPTENDVVFVPNEKELVRNEDYFNQEMWNIEDLMAKKTMQGILENKQPIAETEQPNEDIIFVTGKNNENEEIFGKSQASQRGMHSDVPKETKQPKAPPKINCKDLNCNNTVASVCGGKLENYQMRYRLFMNECYFRKVNCNFLNAINRFKQVPMDRCSNIGVHLSERPVVKPMRQFENQPVQVNNTRRIYSRRSMTMNTDGQFCDHPCPTSCPEDYNPECAITQKGKRRVFVNHCRLDYNSCTYDVVWQKRPLSECVGDRKADMRQNRGFIGWMQRVGIVDKKGRLTLS